MLHLKVTNSVDIPNPTFSIPFVHPKANGDKHSVLQIHDCPGKGWMLRCNEWRAPWIAETSYEQWYMEAGVKRCTGWVCYQAMIQPGECGARF